VTITAAERKADQFVTQVEKRIARLNASDRYTVEKKVTSTGEPLNSISVVVTIQDTKLLGRIWLQWMTFTYDGHANTARFLGGRYSWSIFDKNRRLKRNYRRVWNIIDTFIWTPSKETTDAGTA
jgi:hypothetical protein